jgi:hypothetical protein
VGNGDHDQDGAEPASVASSISAVGERDASEGAACQRSAPSLLILRVSREKFLYELKAGPAARQRRGGHRGASLTFPPGGAEAITRQATSGSHSATDDQIATTPLLPVCIAVAHRRGLHRAPQVPGRASYGAASLNITDLKRFASSGDVIGVVLAGWRHETNCLPPQCPRPA